MHLVRMPEKPMHTHSAPVMHPAAAVHASPIPPRRKEVSSEG
jgi:hypothetical protein